MGKFEKSASDTLLEPIDFFNKHDSLPVGPDPLRFVVETSDGVFCDIDLTRYRDGNSEQNLIGFPKLIMELLPVIKQNIGQRNRSKKGIASWMHKSVFTIFRFLTDLKRTTGAAPESIDDFRDGDGVLLKRYLLQLGGSEKDRRKQYTAAQSIITGLRSEAAPRLRWPSIDLLPEREVHDDVDPRAVKVLYHVCKRIIEAGDLSFQRGQALLGEGVDPRDVTSKRSRANWERIPEWRSHANLAVLQRKIMEDRIIHARLPEKATADRIHRFTIPSHENRCYAGIRFADLIAASAPSMIEIAASILLVSMETGWIDGVWGIDLKSEWYSLRRGESVDNLKKTDSVVIFAERPKTRSRLTAIGLAGSRFRSFYLIRQLEERTDFLRKCLRARRELLQANGSSHSTQVEIAKIDRKLKSPWIFYNSKGLGTDGVGLPKAESLHMAMKGLKEMAVISLGPTQNKDKLLVEAIRALKWSDMRDAFASHIFNSSGGNIYLVKRALDHKHLSTTRIYLRQNRQIRERFDAFRKVMDTAFTELNNGRVVDPTILFLSANYRNFNEVDREKLANYRTRMGMGCANPLDPDNYLAPNHIKGLACAVQRCVICRHGIIFKDAFAGLAERHADLVWLRSRTSPDRWLMSTLSWEMESIELARDTIFSDKIEAFRECSGDRLAAIMSGRRHVFDDPEIIAGVG